MSRGDWWTVAVTLVLAGASYFIGGAKIAVAALVVGFGIGLYLHLTRGTQETRASGPQPSLEYSAQQAQQHMTHSGLFVRNCGDKSAFKTTLICDPVGKLRLRFDDMPIQRIEPDSSHPIRVYMEQLGTNGIWCSQGGTLGMQIEMCFERMDDTGDQRQRIPVTIKCFDYEGKKEHTTRWFILRDGEMFADKRIWCEMAQAAGSAS